MSYLHQVLLALAAAAGLTAEIAEEVSPDDLIRRGNAAFALGDPAGADRSYAGAESRSEDPGLVAFNRAAVLFGRDEFREAEVHYLRALADAAIPPDRRTKALFNRGVCLLHRGGDSALYRTAVACFEQCLDARPAEPTLVADAQHNLEVAKILWGRARLREKLRPRANDPHPEDLLPEARPVHALGEDGGSDEGREPGGPEQGMKPEPAGESGTDRAPRSTERKSPGAGNLPVVKNTPTPQVLSPEDTRSLLLRTQDRLEKDRKNTARLLAGPERPDVRDW